MSKRNCSQARESEIGAFVFQDLMIVTCQKNQLSIKHVNRMLIGPYNMHGFVNEQCFVYVTMAVKFEK